MPYERLYNECSLCVTQIRYHRLLQSDKGRHMQRCCNSSAVAWYGLISYTLNHDRAISCRICHNTGYWVTTAHWPLHEVYSDVYTCQGLYLRLLVLCTHLFKSHCRSVMHLAKMLQHSLQSKAHDMYYLTQKVSSNGGKHSLYLYRDVSRNTPLHMTTFLLFTGNT